jgi:DNA-binding NarL/FixJ family response regulator
MIRVLIADDHAIVRTGLRQIFSLVPDLHVVAEAENAAQTMALLQQHAVDLVLLDLNMPGSVGVELVARIRANRAELPILVLTMYNEAPMAASVLRAGANGYITKDCDLGVLLPAIRAVAGHGHYLSPGLAEKVLFHDTPTAGSAPHLKLTVREAEVFRLLTQGAGVSEIASQLALSGKTVSTYKLRLQNKLRCGNVAELMRYAMRHHLLN